MSRKVETAIVPEWGARDAGKMFRITEMSAAHAEKWAWRGLLMLKGSGAAIPEGVEHLGMVGVFRVGLNAFLGGSIRFEELEPWLDEMMGCLTFVSDQKHLELARPLLEDDISEVKTRLWLRSEIIRVHTDFSVADALFALVAAATPETSTS